MESDTPEICLISLFLITPPPNSQTHYNSSSSSEVLLQYFSLDEDESPPYIPVGELSDCLEDCDDFSWKLSTL